MANHGNPPKQPPTPTKPHPEISGVAWFRDKDGWRAGKISTRDPSLFVSLSEPNLKSITVDVLRRGVVDIWETDS